MNPEISIRKAEPEDVPFVIECNRAMALEIEGKDLSPETLTGGEGGSEKAPWGFYLIAEVSQQPVGCLMVTAENNGGRNELFWWIQCIYVKPDFRRRGIYRSLYQRVKILAQLQNNVTGLRLYVDENNVAAQHAYRALGMSASRNKLFEEMLKPE